jgi:hypothetical protein
MSESIDDVDEDVLFPICEALTLGHVHGGWECEIIWSAMLYIKKHPNCTIEEACEYGISEWIK